MAQFVSRVSVFVAKPRAPSSKKVAQFLHYCVTNQHTGVVLNIPRLRRRNKNSVCLKSYELQWIQCFLAYIVS